MIYKNTMINVLNYIDTNIKDSINIDVLAEITSYSVPHFFRLFLSYMNISPMNYVLKRKLYFAARELVMNETKIVDIAFSYGFESHDAFGRAFKRVYGVTPSEFRKNSFQLNSFYRENLYCVSSFTIPNSLINQVKDDENMVKQIEHEVRIVTLPETKLIGIERIIGEEEGIFEVFYEAYDRIFRNAQNRKYPNSENATHALSELMPDGRWNYFIGIEVTSLDNIPDGAVGRELPVQLCAVIGYEGGLDYRTITEYLYGVWLERNTYKVAHRFAGTWEYYTPNKDCDVYEERIYMPIMPMEYDIIEIPKYSGVYVRGVSENGSQAKEKAFSTMLTWLKLHKLFWQGEVKLEVFYGKDENDNVFCEIFYRTNYELPLCDDMKRKSYPSKKYFHSSNMHHNLEQNSRAIYRFIKKETKFKISDICDTQQKIDDRPYFEEYRLCGPELNMYTPLDVYICIE